MAKKYKTALVTGGAGFIGSHVVDALIKRRIKVYVIDNLSTGFKKNVNPNAHFTKMSILSPQLPKYLKRIKPDVVFHLAAQINLRDSVSDPCGDLETNVYGTLFLAHECAKLNVKKFVFSSTGGAIYSEGTRPPCHEGALAEPLSPYGIAKRSGEMYLRFLYQVHGMPYVALRYSNVYGPRQNAKGEAGVVSIFTERMLRGEPTIINGNGKQTRDYVYVSDVVRANMMAMYRNVSGEFNIGTGKQTNVNLLWKKLKKLTDYKLPERHGPAPPGELMRSALDARKARKYLGWEPKVKLDDGLKKTVKWFKNK